MMSENNPDVVRELVAHRQTTIRNAMTRRQNAASPPRYRALIGHFIIRLGEGVRGPEILSGPTDTRPSMHAHPTRRVRQA